MDKTVETALTEVKKQLQLAIELEHSTIPPYLYAYWSMKDHSSQICSNLFDVIKEEMLHMGLACNILNALGGSPEIATPKFIPDYPTALPAHDMTHDPFVVSLQKCGIEAVVTFLHIELPRDMGLLPHEDPVPDTIGQFYGQIIDNLNMLDESHFQCGAQMAQECAPYKKGELFCVDSKESALRAIDEIIEQGEGMSIGGKHHAEGETHFNSFMQLYKDMGGKGEITPHSFNTDELVQTIDEEKYREFLLGVKPVVTDPKTNNSERIEAFVTNRRFNSAYSHMLDLLHRAMTSADPDMSPCIQAMFALTRPALQLMSIPVDPKAPTQAFCGPTFEYIPKNERI